MPLEPLLNPLFLLPTGAVVIGDFLSLLLYFRWIRKGERRKAKWLLAFKPLSTLVCIYFMFTQFGAGFFAGAVYLLLSPFASISMFIVFVVQAIYFRKELGFPGKSYITNILWGLLIVISIAIPAVVYSPIKDRCADADSAKILVMSKAIEAYYAENGQYPKTFDELTPRFLSAIPAPTCHLLSGFSYSFYLNTCSPAKSNIYTRTLDGMGFEIYSLEDGTRTRLHSFLDGTPGSCP